MSSDQQELRNWVGWKIVSEDPPYYQNENTSTEIQSFTIDKTPDDIAKRLWVAERVMKARQEQHEVEVEALNQKYTGEKLALAESYSRLMEQNAMLREQVQKGNDYSIGLAIELQQVTEAVLKDQARVAKYWCNTRIELKSTKALVLSLREKCHALRAKIARGKARALSGMFETWHKGVFDGLMSQLLPQTSSVDNDCGPSGMKERYKEGFVKWFDAGHTKGYQEGFRFGQEHLDDGNVSPRSPPMVTEFLTPRTSPDRHYANPL